MRAREIIQEDYQESLDSDLSNILVGAKGSGATDINTEDLVLQLRGMGYSVNKNNIMVLLSRNPLVLNATPESVHLTEPEGSGEMNTDTSKQDNADRVTDMAIKAAKNSKKG
jgi:hypothetical protein